MHAELTRWRGFASHAIHPRPERRGFPRSLIKLYQSEKVEEYGEFVNQRVVLRPQTNAFGYRDIVLEDELEDLKVIGEFLSVL